MRTNKMNKHKEVKDSVLQKIDLSFFILENNEEKLKISGDFLIEEDSYPLNLTLKSKNFKISPFSKLIKNSISDFEGLVFENSRLPVHHCRRQKR